MRTSMLRAVATVRLRAAMVHLAPLPEVRRPVHRPEAATRRLAVIRLQVAISLRPDIRRTAGRWLLPAAAR